MDNSGYVDDHSETLWHNDSGYVGGHFEHLLKWIIVGVMVGIFKNCGIRIVGRLVLILKIC